MNVKNIVLGIGIVVVFALALWQGIEAFYPSPQYKDYCDIGPRAPGAENNITACKNSGGVWRNDYCDYYYECQKKYDAAKNPHSRVVFFISLIVAIIAIIVGFSILNIEPVGSALIGSGIWAVFWGSVVNWRNLSDIWRFLLLLVVLVLLIWIAIKLNKKENFMSRVFGKKR